MAELTYRNTVELDAGLDLIRQAPREAGVLKLIVCRKNPGEREILKEGELDVVTGLVGDTWKTRGSKSTPDGSAHPELQLTLMNVRSIAQIAAEPERWPLAGDQLFVDFDISLGHLPTGARVALGEAVVEITEYPHTGCSKFSARFGPEALKWVNSPLGRELRLRGVNARVVQPGKIRTGDVVRKVA